MPVTVVATGATFTRSDKMRVESPSFSQGGSIPGKFTCQGENITPALSISGLPEGTRSMAIIVDDPDAPMGTWVHWVAWNIAPEKTSTSEGEQPGTQGINDSGGSGYGGPCPPRGPSHTYRFKVYALDTTIDLEEGATKAQLESAMKGHILAKAELDGEYQRQ